MINFRSNWCKYFFNFTYSIFAMKKLTLFIFIVLFHTITAQNFAQYLNPFIGTGGHGHTFPGATVPFGTVSYTHLDVYKRQEFRFKAIIL